jgi:UDP-N-acetylglucosamine 2-epimerase (non-hydrolysing)
MKIHKGDLMKIGVVIGTRPEAIKMIPIIKKIRESNIDVVVVNTGQHQKMIDIIFNDFGEEYDYNLNVMSDNQSLANLTGLIINELDVLFKKIRFDFVLVHGDTLTSFVASLAAFWNKIQVAHIEAGLRTHNIYSPFPEEMNRQLTGRIATVHFAPTEQSVSNLIEEGIKRDSIILSGNSVIDALLIMKERISNIPNLMHEIEFTLGTKILNWVGRMVLITGHRRENFGSNFKEFTIAINELAIKYPETLFVYPVHLNPNVKEIIYGEVQMKPNVALISPVDYKTFIYLMEKSYLILTDSGGVQEEAPSLGKPVLVMRDTTERQEAIDCGCAKLIGMKTDSIISEVSLLLESSIEYKKMSNIANPYGTGNTSDIILNYFLAK